MARGGKRPNAGRKAGSVTKRTREIANRASEEGILPLEYMLRVLRDEEQKPEVRFEAAKAAAPYVHAKLASVEQKHSGSIGTTTKEQRDAAVEAALRADS
jgi:hypothetical protein